MIETLILIVIIALTAYELSDLLVYQDGPYMVFDKIRHIAGVYEVGETEDYNLIGSILGCPYCCSVWMVVAVSVVVLPFVMVPYLWLVPIAAMGLITLTLDYKG